MQLITAGGDSSVKVWDLRMGDTLHVLPFRAAVTALSFDANSLAVATADASLKVRGVMLHYKPITACRYLIAWGTKLSECSRDTKALL